MLVQHKNTIVTYLGLFSSAGNCFVSTSGDGEFGRSRSAPKSMLSKSGRFLFPLPDRARLAQDRSRHFCCCC